MIRTPTGRCSAQPCRQTGESSWWASSPTSSPRRGTTSPASTRTEHSTPSTRTPMASSVVLPFRRMGRSSSAGTSPTSQPQPETASLVSTQMAPSTQPSTRTQMEWFTVSPSKQMERSSSAACSPTLEAELNPIWRASTLTGRWTLLDSPLKLAP